MSKSKGNVIQPEEIINKYGADSLRLMYIVGNKAGAGYPISYEKLEGYKRFLNKIWNASKFVLMNTTELEESEGEIDEKLMGELDQLVKDVTKHIDNYRIGLAAEMLYQHFWHTFCDVYLEEVKPKLYTKDKEGNPINTSVEAQAERQKCQRTMINALRTYLKLLHPFVPFITDKIWKEIHQGNTIMYEKWPV